MTWRQSSDSTEVIKDVTRISTWIFEEKSFFPVTVLFTTSLFCGQRKSFLFIIHLSRLDVMRPERLHHDRKTLNEDYRQEREFSLILPSFCVLSFFLTNRETSSWKEVSAWYASATKTTQKANDDEQKAYSFCLSVFCDISFLSFCTSFVSQIRKSRSLLVSEFCDKIFWREIESHRSLWWLKWKMWWRSGSLETSQKRSISDSSRKSFSVSWMLKLKLLYFISCLADSVTPFVMIESLSCFVIHVSLERYSTTFVCIWFNLEKENIVWSFFSSLLTTP